MIGVKNVKQAVLKDVLVSQYQILMRADKMNSDVKSEAISNSSHHPVVEASGN